MVGGAVRDLLLEAKKLHNNKVARLSPLVDIDITTNAKPEETIKLFPEAFYENKFGTVSISYEHLWELMGVSDKYINAFRLQLKTLTQPKKERLIDLAKATKIHPSLVQEIEERKIEDRSNSKSIHNLKSSLPLFEITTFRSKEVYEGDFRRPTKIEWGQTLSEDLKRRDFTINALAIKVADEALVQASKQLQAQKISIAGLTLAHNQYQLVDEHQGLKDLQASLVRTVGNPNKRFQEDALRMLRAIRFAVQLKFKIEKNTLDAIKTNANLIKHISWERIRDEFLKMLVSPEPKKAIELMDQTGLLRFILPELLATKGVKQGGHHTTDVWTHSLDSLQACPSSDPIVKLATLLHDIAKPQTQGKNKAGDISFYNHEVIGARVAKKIAKRLKLSKKDQDRIFTLVRYHMFHYQPQNTDASVRRFMRKVGLENIDDILDLREGDRLGSGARKTSWRLEEFKQRMIKQLNQPMEITDLAINGHDLMNELGLKPGPQIGKILKTLFEEVLENPELNKKEILLKKAKEFING